MKNFPYYAPVILRVGLAMVFVWFGATQILDQASWTSLIPAWIVSASGMSATAWVIANGLFEVAAGGLLAFGVWNRVVAFLLFLHLCSIIMDVGLSSVGVRDIGLAFGALSVSFYGYDIMSLCASPHPTPSPNTFA